MSIMGVAGVASAVPAPTRQEIAAIVSARPAVLQLQAVARPALDRGTGGQGTPAVDANGSIDVYA
jgi:hypothetical protein